MTQIFKSDPNAKDVFDHKKNQLHSGDRLVIADESNGTRVPIFRHVRFIKYCTAPDRFFYVDDIGDERDAWLDDIDSIWLDGMGCNEAKTLLDSYCKWDLPENEADAVYRLQHYSYYDFFTPDGQIKNAEAQDRLDAVIYGRI